LLKLSAGFSLLTCSGLLRQFSWVWTLRAIELVDVISQDVWISQHRAKSTTLLTGSLDDLTHLLATLDLLD
jgi:hypothetical protein